MSANNTGVKKLFADQQQALRDPVQICAGAARKDFGLVPGSLKFEADKDFISVLKRCGVNLLLSREYEHLLISLGIRAGKLQQSFFPLPHPSGIAVHPSGRFFYVASTRNPNLIQEFALTDNPLSRLESKGSPDRGIWFPSRCKYYPGATYLHDLVMIGNELFANSVGFNSLFKVDFSATGQEPLLWWPPSVEHEGAPDTRANFLQLNSIAAGENITSSFVTASCESPQQYRPGHKNFKVDGTGVIFELKSGNVVARGLTRPHSARLLNSKIWLCNSGYGQVGYISNGEFISAASFNGWTRGLCFVKDILFVGVSRILPGFEHYAPGIKTKHQQCGVYALDTNSGRIIGSILFPMGNQIFAIEAVPSKPAKEFPLRKLSKSQKKDVQLFYQSTIQYESTGV